MTDIIGWSIALVVWFVFILLIKREQKIQQIARQNETLYMIHLLMQISEKLGIDTNDDS